MKKEVAEKAAKWWANTLCRPHDNGANDEANKMGMILADFFAASHKPTDEQIAKFTELLTKEFETMDSDDRRISIYCDYSPDPILEKIADEVGIDSLAFPFKAGMLITGDKVEVRPGYYCPYEEI